MIYRKAVLVMWAVALLCAPSVARGADVDDLKATFEQQVKDFNERNLDAFMAAWHDQAVSVVGSNLLPSDGKAATRQAYQNIFDTTESATFNPVNPQFRVIGSMGLAWGSYLYTFQPKDGAMEAVAGRYTGAYTKADGKWLALELHFSDFPSGN